MKHRTKPLLVVATAALCLALAACDSSAGADADVAPGPDTGSTTSPPDSGPGDTGPVTTSDTGPGVPLPGPGATPANPHDGPPVALGFVINDLLEPVEGASVSAGGMANTTTDANGRFSLTLPSATAPAVVRFSKPGHADAFRKIEPARAPMTTVSVVLSPFAETTQVDISTQEAVVDVYFGALTLTIPAAGLVDGAGSVPSGPVTVSVALIEPSFATDDSPAPMEADDPGQAGQSWPLVSYGMFDITATAADGSALQVAPGKTLTVKTEAAAEDPATSELFSVDPSTGRWTLEPGLATNDGTHWTAQIPHLSWWNIDAFWKVPEDERCCVRFVAIDCEGRPVRGVEIRSAWGPSDQYTIAGSTDLDGTLCDWRFRCGEPLRVAYAGFLEEGSQTWVTGNVGVIPTARGVTCDSPLCQTVLIPFRCLVNDDPVAGQWSGTGQVDAITLAPSYTGPFTSVTVGDQLPAEVYFFKTGSEYWFYGPPLGSVEPQQIAATFDGAVLSFDTSYELDLAPFDGHRMSAAASFTVDVEKLTGTMHVRADYIAGPAPITDAAVIDYSFELERP